MKKLFASLMIATMLVPTGALASSTRPGSRVTHKSLNSNPRTRGPSCLVEDKWTPCEVTIDETGVTHPIGKITKVVKWSEVEKDFNVAGGIVGGVAGAGVGAAAGMTTCMFMGPFCLIAAPAIMQTGMGVGGGVGGKGVGKYFTVIGDDKDGNRLIQEFHVKSGKEVRKKSKLLLKTTGLADGELKG